jgi:hypothetical protein
VDDEQRSSRSMIGIDLGRISPPKRIQTHPKARRRPGYPQSGTIAEVQPIIADDAGCIAECAESHYFVCSLVGDLAVLCVEVVIVMTNKLPLALLSATEGPDMKE